MDPFSLEPKQLARKRAALQAVLAFFPTAFYAQARFEPSTIPRGEWVIPTRETNASPILYIHGGAFVAGSPASHRSLTSRIAQVTQRSVFSCAYRLCPECTFPAALEDVLAAIRYTDAKILMGDSAGGNLAVSAALQLQGIQRLVLFSPWLDLSLQSLSWVRAQDVLLRRDKAEMIAASYAGSISRQDPRVSPLFSTSLERLPATLIHVGGADALKDDSIRLVETSGGDVEVVVWEEMPHVFPLFGGLESIGALHQVEQFLKEFHS